jgi:hypothetical protein
MGLLALLLAAGQIHDPPSQVQVEAAVKRGLLYAKANAPAAPGLVLGTIAAVDQDETDPLLATLLSKALAVPPAGTMQAALLAETLLDANPLKYVRQQRVLAQFFADNQCADGLWGEGAAIDPVDVPEEFGPPRRWPLRVSYTVQPRRAGPATGDALTTSWALRGMRACESLGARFGPEQVARAVAGWRAADRPDVETLATLSILRYLQGKDCRKDVDLLSAFQRLGCAERPADPQGLEALRRAVTLYGRDDLGGPGWYLQGVRALLASQAPDGSWKDVETTCAAVQFLRVPRPPREELSPRRR